MHLDRNWNHSGCYREGLAGFVGEAAADVGYAAADVVVVEHLKAERLRYRPPFLNDCSSDY